MDQQLLVEKEEFIVIKEKIIKTNDLLVLYNDKNEKLTKATQAFKSLKLKNESLNSDINRLTEDNERFMEIIGHLKPDHEAKQKELQNLQTEYSKLEKLYHKHLLESQSTLTQLQTESKQCTCEAKLSLSPCSRRKTTADKIRQLKQVCSDLKSIESKLRIENRNLVKRNKVLEENCLNAEGSSGDLKKELETVKHQLKIAETSLQKQADLKQLALDALKKKHEEEVAVLNKQISYLNLDSDKVKQLENECELLRKQLAKYQESVIELKAIKLEVSTQTEVHEEVKVKDHFEAGFVPTEEEIEPEKDCLNDIFNEMILPWTMLSPLRSSPRPIATPSPVLQNLQPLPNIIVTPPTSGIDAQPAKLRRRNKKFWMPFAFNTLVKRRRRVIKAKPSKENDVILKALQTLQRNKITFTISNQSETSRKLERDVYTSQSKCWHQNNASAKNAMLLRGRLSDDDDAELLGFYRPESGPKTATEPVVSSPSANLKDVIQQLLAGIKEISTNSNGSKRRRSSKKRGEAKVSEFNSTTESELERLFLESSDVLVRNRKLLAVAKEQTSHCDTLSEIDSDLMVDSGLVTATPVNDSDSLLSPSTISEGFKGFGRHDVTMSTLFVHAAQRCQTQKEKGYETPVCPVLISPLASSTKSSQLSTPLKDSPYSFKIPPTPCSDIEYYKTPTVVQSIGQFDLNKLEVSEMAPIQADVSQKLDLDLSVRTEDLNNCSLSDLHISQLDVSERDIRVPKRNCEEDSNDEPKNSQLGSVKRKILSREYISSDSSDSDQSVKSTSIRKPVSKLKTPPKRSVTMPNEEKTSGKITKPQKSKLKTPPRRSLRLSTSKIEAESKSTPSGGLQQRLSSVDRDHPVLPPPIKSKIPYRKNICDNSSCATTIEVKNPPYQKINIVQDILITNNNKAIDLLAARGRSSILKKNCRKSGENTPVDILSKLMHDMTNNRPALPPQPKFSTQPQTQPVSTPTQLKEEEKDDFADCPKSPEVMEEPEEAPPPKLIPEDTPTVLLPDEMALLLRDLMVFANEEKKVEEIALQLAFQDINRVTWAIADKLQQDVTNKADVTMPFSPPLTQTQRILIGFLIKLDKSTHPGIIKVFQKAVQRILYDPVRTCKLPSVQPLTRVHTALFKMNNDLDGIRRFVCECFYFSGDFAVPILFTVLTIWANVLPMEAQLSDVPIAKLIVHLSYLKFCNEPGYNLMPLRDLFKNYYGYPTERWCCDDIFQGLLVDYIRNPALKTAQFGLLLFLKNKPAKWVNQKVKESLLPLYQRIPDTNPHLKATLLLFYANIHRYFSRKDPEESNFIDEISGWFRSLQHVEEHQDIKDALKIALNRLPKRTSKKQKVNKSQQNSTSSNSANVSDPSSSIKVNNQNVNVNNGSASEDNLTITIKTEDGSDVTSEVEF